MTLASVLRFGNLIFSSINVIIGFSLLAYVLAHNLRSPVARAFCALMAQVTIVYVVDVSLAEVTSAASASAWLRVQWLGIAFVPAAYFHFSDALLRTTGAMSPSRRIGVFGGYALGLVAFALAAFSRSLVADVALKEHIYHLTPGPLFWAFTAYYVLFSITGWLNISRARRRCLTSTSRRRMSYLMLAFMAPGIGAFPYLLVPMTGQYLSVNVISLLNLLADLGIALMMVVIGYIVAYQGVLLPDRVIKHRLIHYLLRGPVVAILVMVPMLTIPRVEHIMGLPRDTVLIVAVAASVVVWQLLINVGKPAIDRLIYRRDRDEVAWIQTLDQRLLTSNDLEQLLENTLVALCDLLRSPSGFVVTMQNTSLALRVFCGPRHEAASFLSRANLGQLLAALASSRRAEAFTEDDLVPADGHWLLPLRSRNEQQTLGILGMRAVERSQPLRDADLEAARELVRQMELALEDIQLQQQVFSVLRGLDSELDRLQELRSTPRYAGERTLQSLEASPILSPAFVQAVKDALSHLWGGPKLSHSPLIRLSLVQSRMEDHDNVPAKAARAVLQEAIERLRPDGAQSLTSNEWMVYNILDLRFLQGQRIRDIASRLAISESDYYRKQRVAVAQLSETLVQMERDHLERQRAH